MEFTNEEIRIMREGLKKLRNIDIGELDRIVGGINGDDAIRELEKILKKLEYIPDDTPEGYIEKHPYVFHKGGGKGEQFKVKIREMNGFKFLLVPIPSANTQWTFKAFDYVKDFCKKFQQCYPDYHNDKGKDHSKYLYVKINKEYL